MRTNPPGISERGIAALGEEILKELMSQETGVRI